MRGSEPVQEQPRDDRTDELAGRLVRAERSEVALVRPLRPERGDERLRRHGEADVEQPARELRDGERGEARPRDEPEREGDRAERAEPHDGVAAAPVDEPPERDAEEHGQHVAAGDQRTDQERRRAERDGRERHEDVEHGEGEGDAAHPHVQQPQRGLPPGRGSAVTGVPKGVASLARCPYTRPVHGVPVSSIRGQSALEVRVRGAVGWPVPQAVIAGASLVGLMAAVRLREVGYDVVVVDRDPLRTGRGTDSGRSPTPARGGRRRGFRAVGGPIRHVSKTGGAGGTDPATVDLGAWWSAAQADAIAVGVAVRREPPGRRRGDRPGPRRGRPDRPGPAAGRRPDRGGRRRCDRHHAGARGPAPGRARGRGVVHGPRSRRRRRRTGPRSSGRPPPSRCTPRSRSATRGAPRGSARTAASAPPASDAIASPATTWIA